MVRLWGLASQTRSNIRQERRLRTSPTHSLGTIRATQTRRSNSFFCSSPPLPFTLWHMLSPLLPFITTRSAICRGACESLNALAHERMRLLAEACDGGGGERHAESRRQNGWQADAGTRRSVTVHRCYSNDRGNPRPRLRSTTEFLLRHFSPFVAPSREHAVKKDLALHNVSLPDERSRRSCLILLRGPRETRAMRDAVVEGVG